MLKKHVACSLINHSEIMKINFRFILLMFISISTTQAQVDPVSKSGVAVGGYDVVAYFQSATAVKGIKQLKSELNGVSYYFSAEDNKKQFDESPEKYLPQYDGYCALSVTYGKKLSIDPETFRIINNKLYLFFNGDTSNGKVNSLKVWDKNEAKYVSKADALWPEVKKRKYVPVGTE